MSRENEASIEFFHSEKAAQYNGEGQSKTLVVHRLNMFKMLFQVSGNIV